MSLLFRKCSMNKFRAQSNTALLRNYGVCGTKLCKDIPYVDLYENNPETVINIRDFCHGKKVVIFGVPGPFTPTCSNRHLKGFLRKAHEFKKMGVDEIACVAVSDPYVMAAWGRHNDAEGRVRMLADTNACLAHALGVTICLKMLGGIKTKRYSMVVINTIIQVFNVEPSGTSLTISGADKLAV